MDGKNVEADIENAEAEKWRGQLNWLVAVGSSFPGNMCAKWWCVKHDMFSVLIYLEIQIFLDVYLHGGWQAMFQCDKKPPQTEEFIWVFPNHSDINYKSIWGKK